MGTTTYTKEVGDKICERLAEGESLRKICVGADMPGKSTVFRWLEENESFRDQYARAREWQAESIMDEVLDIADYTAKDTVTITKGRGDNAVEVEVPDMEWIQRSKLRVEARLKVAGQLHPKKYGPKMSLAVTDTNPISQLTDQELLDELRKLAPPQ